MDLFLLLESECNGLGPILLIIYKILQIFWILIPIALIVFGTIDLGKAVIASDEKEVKAAQTRLINRFIYAALVFFVPILVSAVMNLVGDAVQKSDSGTKSETGTWSDCYTWIMKQN